MCGLLQSNPAGVATVRVCQCAEGSACDLIWDSRQQVQKQLVRLKRIQQQLSGKILRRGKEGGFFTSLVEEQYKVDGC